MKSSKRAISKLNILLILASSLILASASVYSFSTGGGIYGKCDTQGTGSCKEIWEFRFGSGLCVTEEDGLAPDDNCCVGYAKGVVLGKGGALSDIQTTGCSSPDSAGDYPQDVLWTRF